tara:strand:- start:740 stop:1216 length:477 start_codon:yes stop_codon:yes gene_type:complete
MDFLRIAILMAHPILSIMLIWAFLRQRSWRREKTFLKQNEKTAAIREHERTGNRIMGYLLLVIAVAFASRIIDSIMRGDELAEASKQLMPGHYHGWAGILGLLLMSNLWYLGRKTSRSRDDRDAFSRTRNLHGRLGDVMAILIIIHAFLGFLYLLQII